MKRNLHIIAAVLTVFLIAGCNEANKADSSAGINASESDSGEAASANFEGDEAADPDFAADEDFALLEDELEEEMIDVPDPLEGINRVMFNVNDALYMWVVDPVSRFYADTVPEPTRTSIDNFFSNLGTPARYANCLLQGKGDGADIELRRFWINTTEGILGFGDPALEKHRLEKVQEDFGQTLAVWGLDDGFYIVWPLLGPSTLRDSIGLAGDQFLNPLRYVEPVEISYGASGLKGVNKSSFNIGEYEVFKDAAVDPYIAMRQAYMQYRAGKIEE